MTPQQYVALGKAVNQLVDFFNSLDIPDPPVIAQAAPAPIHAEPTADQMARLRRERLRLGWKQGEVMEYSKLYFGWSPLDMSSAQLEQLIRDLAARESGPYEPNPADPPF
jgi:hypothetical protein